jgi:hypothetical protein
MPCKSKTVAVLRFRGEARSETPFDQNRGPVPFLTPPKWSATALRQCGQRMMEERVDCTILLEQSDNDQTPRTRSPGERVTHPWLLTLTSLIVILLLSLGLRWVVWKLASP